MIENHEERHGRRSIRLKGYDYTKPGAYFVTLVAVDRTYLFGNIKDGKMELNDFGKIAEMCWHEIPQHFKNVQLDAFVIMPNHIHGIIIINENDDKIGADNCRGNACVTQTKTEGACVIQTKAKAKPIPGSLGVIVGSYKSAISKRINELRKMPGKKVWHRNYYESIARSETGLNRIRQYIISNPANWDKDEENEELMK